MDKEKQLEARISLTKEIMAWQEGKECVVLTLATGVGKSGVAMNIINSVKHDKVLFSASQTPLKKNFTDDCEKLGFNHLLPNIELTCHASLKKYISQEFDVVCLDEAQWVVSEAKIEILKQIKAKKIVILSATLDKEAMEALSKVWDLNVFSVPYEEGVRRGILPEIEYEIRRVSLDNTKKSIKVEYKWKGKLETAYRTEAQHYSKLNDNVKYWVDRYESDKAPWIKNKLLRAGLDRQSFLGGLKTSYIREELDKLGDSRCIVFCSSIEQAKELGSENAVHSKRTAKQNQAIIDGYNNYESNRLFCRNMLTEGINIVDTSFCVIGALGTKELRATQVAGRISRASTPKMIIICYLDTVDEKFLAKSFGLDVYGNKLTNTLETF